jgi:hypothetical protein
MKQSSIVELDWFYKCVWFSNGPVIRCPVLSKIDHLNTELVQYSDPNCITSLATVKNRKNMSSNVSIKITFIVVVGCQYSDHLLSYVFVIGLSQESCLVIMSGSDYQTVGLSFISS